MWKELVSCLEDFAALAQLAGTHDEAVRIAAAAKLTRGRLALVRRPAEEARWQARLAALREPLGDERFSALWNEAWDHWETEDAIRSARALPEALPRRPPNENGAPRAPLSPQEGPQALRLRRRAMKPSAPRPPSSMAYVAGSGTGWKIAVATLLEVPQRKSPTALSPDVPQAAYSAGESK